mmetsp:Transcript_43032/g.101077  ORF Transcript_43032/g.101077 Transcript_43032/m.101077 type:complete len:335 (-) Transcript_43032:216-1220(-)
MAVDAVKKSWGITLNDAAQSTIQGEYGSLTRQNIEEYIKDVDIRKFGVSSGLPKEVARQGTMKLPPGKYFVQLQKAADVTQPSKFQEDFEGGKWRLLAFDLSDGEQKMRAIEYSQAKALSVNVPPGSKLLLESTESKPLKLQNGHLLLTGENVHLLGGHVEKLMESWRVSKDVESTRLLWKTEGIKKASSGEGAPPWTDFDPRKARGGTAADKKAMEDERASWLRQGSSKTAAAGNTGSEQKEARFQVDDYVGAEAAVNVKSQVSSSAFKKEEVKGKGGKGGKGFGKKGCSKSKSKSGFERDLEASDGKGKSSFAGPGGGKGRRSRRGKGGGKA